MSHECSTDTFTNPLVYDPERFLQPRNEPSDAKSVMTWGAGVHLCPGKLFALYEIKMATALITTTFEIEIPKVLPPLDYFSSSAFAERQVMCRLKPIESESKPEDSHELIIDGMKVEVFTDGPNSGWLIRDCLDPLKQRAFYQYTIDLSSESSEHREILTAPMDRAYPITYYRLVYTNESNCEEPHKWFQWSRELLEKLKIPGPDLDFNSLYAQLYGLEGTMKVHKDEHVDWGISVNIGASCDFLFGSNTITLHSGDVFIADFSKVDHAVLKIHDNTAPGWFTEHCETFNRIRCSVQIRAVRTLPDQLMTTEQFKSMLVK